MEIWGFPGAASMRGSLLLVDVWTCPDRVRRVCRVLDWGCAQWALLQSVQGERSSDVVASLPVGPGLVRARSDGCSRSSNAVSTMTM
jgi:hypothetical protein